jgi:hypothetical protein
MPVMMTKAQALEIQARHVEHYAKHYGEKVRELVAAATTADQLEDGVEYPSWTINRHIPRGAGIEYLIPEKREAEGWHPNGNT